MFLQITVLSGGNADDADGVQLAAAGARADETGASRGGQRSSDHVADSIATAAESEMRSDADMAAAEQREAEEKAAKEREEAERKAAEERERQEAERKAAEVRERQAQEQRASRSAPAAAPAPAPSTSSVATGGDVWASLAQCESGGNAGINTGNGYYGAFQFSAQTWRAVGGPGLPHQNSYEVQRQFAQKLQAQSGWGQWPACSRKLGLL